MIKKIIYGIIVGILIVLIAFSIFVYIQINQMKPEYSGTSNISGLRKPVTIQWDSSGVVHIQGELTEDVILASGFAAAKERLWQMEITRRLGKGRLSEVFGDTTRKIDRMFLTLGIDSITKSLYQSLSPESKKWLRLYANGINSYLDKIGEKVPIEFLLLKAKPEKWTPQDCLLQNRLMAWFLNFNWKADLLYWQLYSKLTREKFEEILPEWRQNPDIIKSGNLQKIVGELLKLDKQMRIIAGIPGINSGSNSWVIAPPKTNSGYAMLANDPHLSLQLPSLWIEMQLKSSDVDVAGFGFPGSPGIIIGRNRNIAWGLTNGMIDDSDYFIEQVDTLEGVYWSDGQKKPLKMQNVRIKVKNKPDLFFTVYSTEHGPLINNIFPKIKTSQFISLKWVGWDKFDEMLTFIRLARAENWKDFEDALRSYGLPCQNFVYTDVKGNIGYRMGGKVPIRSYRTGLLPKPGNTSKNNWTGWIPFDEMPHLYNPDCGWIITANNRLIDKFPYYLSELWEPPYRAIRIEQLISGAEKIGKTEIQQIQFDTFSSMAQEIYPEILAELKKIHRKNKFEKDIFLLLNNWNYEFSSELIAPSVYEVLQYLLIKNIFEDEMGEDLFKLFTDLPNFYLRIFSQIVQNEQSSWFDDIKTDIHENRKNIIQRSYKETLQFLERRIGKDIERWNWGCLHQFELKHSLGQISLTRMIFNKGPFSAPGNGTTINVGAYQYGKPFDMVAGASLRFIADWSKKEYYWSIIPGGNSGDFLSPYYDNQIELWRSGRLKKVYLNKTYSDRTVLLKPMKK